MQEFERKEFAELIAGVYAYHRTQVSPAVIGMYWRGCQRWSLEQVRKAIDELTMDAEAGKFVPKIGDLTRVLEGTRTDRAQLAWGRLLEAAASVGAYTDVAFDDPAIHATVEDLGGWVKVCRSETKDLGYLQHRFCESYRAYVGRGQFGYPAVLGGDRSPDAMYAKRGLPVPRPRLIGDPQRAQLVIANGGGSKSAVGVGSVAALAMGEITKRIDHADREAA